MIDTFEMIGFYMNDLPDGFTIVGTPLQVDGTGKLSISNMDNDGWMEMRGSLRLPDPDNMIRLTSLDVSV